MENNKEQSTYKLIAEWLETYHSTTDKYKKARAKALIVTKMLPIIKKIARKIARRSYDPIDDMVQAGSIGLLRAIDMYNADENANFRIYAGRHIIGEMKHYLRDRLNTIRVPGHVHELLYRINNFMSTLTSEELNELTSDDVAEALKISPKAVETAYMAERRKTTISLEQLYTEEDSLGYEEVISVNDYNEFRDTEDLKIVLKEVINKLPVDLQTPVKMFYYEDLSQREIADALEINQMQVSRKMKKAFSLLYRMIADNIDEK